MKKIAIIARRCVACGVCEGICPLGAVKVWKGVRAVVDPGKCVGCGKCAKACPASEITIGERQAES